MTRVLITGATTPAGLALIRRLVEDPGVDAVVAVGREPASDWRALFDSPVVHYHQVDLTRERHMRRLLYGPVADHEVDSVVHLALHRRATAWGSKVHRLNVDATRNLLLLSEEQPTIGSFIFRSYSEVYDVCAEQPDLIGEDHPLNLSPRAPQWIRDRVEADLTVCARMGLSDKLRIVVLRCAECFCPDSGSQLHDYLRSSVCFRPLGFDPILNLITVKDVANALYLALVGAAQGVYTVPGADTLPLSEVVKKHRRRSVLMPGPLLAPIYWARSAALGTDFRYDVNSWRFHFSGVLDGRRARAELTYEPEHPIHWPSDGVAQ